MNRKYLVPPKLNEKLLLFGCSIPEWFIVLGFFLIGMFKLNVFFIAVSALIVASSCRIINKSLNGRDIVKLLIKFYFKSQIFGLRGGKNIE